jgi:hypothetical protein
MMKPRTYFYTLNLQKLNLILTFKQIKYFQHLILKRQTKFDTVKHYKKKNLNCETNSSIISPLFIVSIVSLMFL